jgi:hypothetical protein
MKTAFLQYCKCKDTQNSIEPNISVCVIMHAWLLSSFSTALWFVQVYGHVPMDVGLQVNSTKMGGNLPIFAIIRLKKAHTKAYSMYTMPFICCFHLYWKATILGEVSWNAVINSNVWKRRLQSTYFVLLDSVYSSLFEYQISSKSGNKRIVNQISVVFSASVS